MITYTTTADKRDVGNLQLTDEEQRISLRPASGFSIFNPESREYRLSAPYKILHALEKGTLTIMQ